MRIPNYIFGSILEENNIRGWFLTLQRNSMVLKLQYYN
jgi:hypothetical protein